MPAMPDMGLPTPPPSPAKVGDASPRRSLTGQLCLYAPRIGRGRRRAASGPVLQLLQAQDAAALREPQASHPCGPGHALHQAIDEHEFQIHDRVAGGVPTPTLQSARPLRLAAFRPEAAGAAGELAYQAQNTPQLRNATLLARISQMRLGEVTSTVESIVQANESEEGTGELPYLCEVFHQRLAEIFSNVQLPQLSQAADLIFLLQEKAELLPTLKPAAQLNDMLEARLNSFIHHSSRMLESRVDDTLQTNKVAQGGMKGELDHFLKCVQQSQLLARCGVASLKSQKKALDHLLRIVDSAPLVDLQQRADDLCNIEERAIEDALLTRLRRVTFRGCNFADFRALAKAMVALHKSLHIPLFDRVVEKSMCEEVPGLVKAWPLDRLQQEFENEAGLLTITSSCSRVWEVANAEVGTRLLAWVTDIASTFRQTRSLERAQADISAWKRAAQRALSSGVLVFDNSARTQVIDIFARCYDDCLASSDLSRAEEIDRLLFQVGILMGADRRLNNAAMMRQASGRYDDSAANATRNLPPLIRVVGAN
eukprot:CAMPEP_0181439648 /NCGR_PEP_ID=MMETSP1110-20121109/22541_1 /TAXON_ID=174948 /ORGANISM="Symbiodinium sp., Strain CCMP421" /LENGTH=539 /DNA_ID=CAMNT_0023563389 /DNA_START=97 /DNA_END=1719 /DNA_ORIENTATION=+